MGAHLPSVCWYVRLSLLSFFDAEFHYLGPYAVLCVCLLANYPSHLSDVRYALCVYLSLSHTQTSLGVRGRSCACDPVTFLSLSLLPFRIDHLCPCSCFLFPFCSSATFQDATSWRATKAAQKRARNTLSGECGIARISGSLHVPLSIPPHRPSHRPLGVFCGSVGYVHDG